MGDQRELVTVGGRGARPASGFCQVRRGMFERHIVFPCKPKSRLWKCGSRNDFRRNRHQDNLGKKGRVGRKRPHQIVNMSQATVSKTRGAGSRGGRQGNKREWRGQK